MRRRSRSEDAIGPPPTLDLFGVGQVDFLVILRRFWPMVREVRLTITYRIAIVRVHSVEGAKNFVAPSTEDSSSGLSARNYYGKN